VYIGAYGIFPVEAASWVKFRRFDISKLRISKEIFHMESLDPTLGTPALNCRKFMNAIKSVPAGVHLLPC
jgi:hypothetical protein